MSVKRERNGKIVNVLRTTEPVYEGNTVIGTRVWTTTMIRITDPGPDHGRLVQVRTDPEEAVTWAQRMIDTAGSTQELRDDIGHIV